MERAIWSVLDIDQSTLQFGRFQVDAVFRACMDGKYILRVDIWITTYRDGMLAEYMLDPQSLLWTPHDRSIDHVPSSLSCHSLHQLFMYRLTDIQNLNYSLQPLLDPHSEQMVFLFTYAHLPGFYFGI